MGAPSPRVMKSRRLRSAVMDAKAFALNLELQYMSEGPFTLDDIDLYRRWISDIRDVLDEAHNYAIREERGGE